MSQLVPETLSHLSPSHLNYFSQWVEWLHMEMIEELKKRNTANIWCSTGQERYKLIRNTLTQLQSFYNRVNSRIKFYKLLFL